MKALHFQLDGIILVPDCTRQQNENETNDTPDTTTEKSLPDNTPLFG